MGDYHLFHRAGKWLTLIPAPEISGGDIKVIFQARMVSQAKRVCKKFCIN